VKGLGIEVTSPEDGASADIRQSSIWSQPTAYCPRQHLLGQLKEYTYLKVAAAQHHGPSEHALGFIQDEAVGLKLVVPFNRETT
jgi:hypothetical protein